ncbi:MAG TPA: histidine kinase dimerization/phosphoacceptor domain -containing protein [Azospirillaceae bacterium]|nr:histidine kinase dimerization/phosphoacceptor domain -containing protein [Azospirillaceae bacterium]
MSAATLPVPTDQDRTDPLLQALRTAGVTAFEQDAELRYSWISNPPWDKPAAWFIGRSDLEMAERPEEGEALAAIKRRVMATGTPERQTVTLHVGGEPLHYELDLRPRRDAAGTIVGISGAALDVTRHRRAAEALDHSRAELTQALERRELLLRELNHRIKNSLQLISSMLRLQAGQAGDELARDQLDRACQRVSAVAEIHARLYMTEEIGILDFADYLDALCGRVPALAHGNPRLSVTVKADHGDLDVDRAIPLGIIANELVSNAALHGFKGLDGGTIEVSFVREPGRCRLLIADDGLGIIPDKGSERLGLKLVDALTMQLGATLTIRQCRPGTGRPGLCSEVTVPVSKPVKPGV